VTYYHEILSLSIPKGGREVYHQSRVKSSRHRMGSKHQRFSGSDFVPQATHVMVNKESSDVSSGAKRKSSGYLYETHFYEQVLLFNKK